ncbi:hypothetical protein FRC03_009094 [Tulasnella sp. 419]|nr:hypothetical protein FRC02_007752 [Tulasnella sp. 418]KAG8958475.1 hypothetical protein FRC03_009094 [Tulasnella sp. 419]
MGSLSLVSLIKQSPLLSSAAQSNTLEISLTLPNITMKVTSILSSSVILAGWLFTPALAGTCTNVLGCYVCGKAVNNTRWTMTYTTNPIDRACPATDTSHPHCCHIMNWGGSFGSDKRVVCRHQALGANSSKGGNTCSANNRVDVDAFTYADRDWVYGSRNMVRGQWVKFSNNQTAKCIERNGKPYCTVSGPL